MSKIADDPSTPAPGATPPAIHRRSTMEFFNPADVSGRLRRMLPPREKVRENLKTLAWVVPITLVIWIYAERMQVVQTAGPNVLNVPVQITSSDTKLFVQMVDSSPTVNLKLTGPQQALEHVRELLTTGIPRGIHIDIGSSMGIGNNQAVNIVDRIENDNRFKNNGISVQESQPPTLNVDIDRVETRTLPVQIPPGMDNIAPETHFDPPNVTVRGPAQSLKGDLKVYADLSKINLTTPGEHVQSSVPLTLSPPQDKLRVEPPQVSAVLVVRASDVPYVIEDLPIFVDAQPETLKDYKIDFPTFLHNVSVVGPQDKINQLIDKSFKPRGRLLIVPEDLVNTSKPLEEYVLPEGVKVTDASRQVEFKLTSR